jgi:hypothetical protein
MKSRQSIFIILGCLAAGILFFLIQRKWLIIHFTFNPKELIAIHPQHEASRKTIKLFYKKGEKWLHEQTNIVWDEENTAQNTKFLVKQWLLTLQEEHIINPHVSLESIATSTPGSEAYISFDQSLFLPDISIIKKWLIIESLIKTIHYAALPLNSFMLLVHHQPMEDDHLDFSQPIPIQERIS